MRLNQFIAQATGISRRKADEVIIAGQVKVNGAPATVGMNVADTDTVEFNGSTISTPLQKTTIMLNKPVGYVCSRQGQGSKTIYELLPEKLHQLKPVGRLDKDSSGLLLLTNDGQLANQLTHPSFAKKKIYQITVNKELSAVDQDKIMQGIMLDDGISKLQLDGRGKQWTVGMYEGRNRQIRRTFATLGYTIMTLHRTQFGSYSLGNLKPGAFEKAQA